MSVANQVGSLRFEQQKKYGDIAQNTILSSPMMSGAVVPPNVQKSVRTYNANNKTMDNDFINIRSYYQPPYNPQQIAQQNAECERRSKQGWQAMIEGNNPFPTCGFVYKGPPTDKSPYPEYSKFVANILNKPPPGFVMPPGAKYFTDMYDAGKTVNGDICRALRSCAAVNDVPFNGLCGFATDLAYGIPITNGQATYNEEGYYAPAEKIITNKANCPKPTPAQENDANNRNNNSDTNIITEETCYRDKESKQLKRECLIQQVRNAGCSDKGSLYRALSEGTEKNYGSKLDGLRAYQDFQDRAFIQKKPMLNKHLIETGLGTMNDALRNFNDVYKAAVDQSEKSAYNAAARDLCLNAGEFDKYDMCDELLPSTLTSDINLECFQRFFRKAGGTPNGAAYPTQQNIRIIKNAYRRWKDYQNAIMEGVSMLDSTSFDKRKGAFLSLMGVVLKQGGASSLNYGPSEGFTSSSTRGLAHGMEGFVGSSCQISEEQCTNRSTDPRQGSSGRDIAVFKGLSLSGCKKKCCDDRRCKYYTFGDFGDGSMCWLKDGTCNSEPISCKITSGTKA